MTKTKLILLLAVLVIFSAMGCKKDKAATTVYPLQGLWKGTTYSTSQGGNATPFFFSFSFFDDGTMTYKSIDLNSYSFYAAGTWSLSHDTLNFTASILNNPGNTPETQTGIAIYDSTQGTLTNGTISSNTVNGTGAWQMTRVK